MQTKILVSRTAVDHNRATGTNDPVFTIIYPDGTVANSSDILMLGTCALRYDPAAEEGRRVWIETFDKVVLRDGMAIESSSPAVAKIRE